MFLNPGSRGGPKRINSTVTATTWTRPVDWLTLPASQPDHIEILAAVYNDGSNYVALTMTTSSGQYTVDWGDGTVTNYNSNSQANYQYTYSSVTSSVTSLGFKTVIIKITPTTAGQSFTGIDLSLLHSSLANLPYNSPWLDIQINCPSVTSVTLSSNNGSIARFLQRCNIVALSSSITSLQALFFNCCALQKVIFPENCLNNVTSWKQMFNNCFNLTDITFPSGALINAQDISQMFNNCYNITNIVFPAGTCANVTSFNSFAQGASGLRSISFPEGALSNNNLKNISYAFYQCTQLQNITFPTGSFPSVNNCSFIFYSCYALQNVTFGSGAFACTANPIDSSYMFNSAQALEFITFPSGSFANVTTMDSMFQQCLALKSITFPSGGFAGTVTSTNNTFTACYSLSSITNLQVGVNTYISNCNLSNVNLDAIYTSLPSVGAAGSNTKSLTVSNNVGYPTSTVTIANNKGWQLL